MNKGDKSFIDAKINNEEMGIMLFTSGTTSVSKAVMLSHKNIVSNLMDIAAVIKIDENDRFLSFLPLHHTFECTVGFLYPVSKGSCIAFCEGIRHIADNIKEYKITAMISVPILFETMYKKVLKAIESDKYDCIILNYANTDMVGHTGSLKAAIKAVEAVDECVGKVVKLVESKNGNLLITADHGNAEQMIDYSTGEPHTAHTTNPVPLILVTKNEELKLKSGGKLADLAPTMLDLMNLEKPEEMTGESLLDKE